MPASSPRPAIRESRGTVLREFGRTDPAAVTPPQRNNSLVLTMVPGVAILCGLIVFLLLSYSGGTLPHATVRPTLRTSSGQAVSIPETIAPAAAEEKSVENTPAAVTPIKLHRSRKYTRIARLRMRLVRIGPHRKWCDLLIHEDRKHLVQVRAEIGKAVDLSLNGGSPDSPVERLRIDRITKTAVEGVIESGSAKPSAGPGL